MPFDTLIIYIAASKQKIHLGNALISFSILFVLALPLMLFVLVNKGCISEIITRFISIPKLLAMRDSEISISNLFSWDSYHNLLNTVLHQNDGLIWNSISDYGIYYKFSLPFILLGGIKLMSSTIKNVRNKVFGYEGIFLLGLLCSLFTCLIISNANVNKTNSLHFYILILLTLGIEEVFIICRKYPLINKTIAVGYAIASMFFLSYYFGGYNDQISYSFREGVEDAVSYVNDENFMDVCVDSSIFYSQILFFDKTPHEVYSQTVKYANYPSAFLNVEEFGKYKFEIDYDNLSEHEAYIINNNKKEEFISLGYKVISFQNYSVAHKNYD